MSILKHIAFSAAAIAVVAGIPYCANLFQQQSIARNEQKKQQLDELLRVTPNTSFQVIETSKQQAIIRDANGIWIMRVGDVLPNGEKITAIGKDIRTDSGSTYSAN